MTVLQSRILSSEVESFSFFCLEILFRVKPRMCAIVKKKSQLSYWENYLWKILGNSDCGKTTGGQ